MALFREFLPQDGHPNPSGVARYVAENTKQLPRTQHRKIVCFACALWCVCCVYVCCVCVVFVCVSWVCVCVLCVCALGVCVVSLRSY